MRDADNYVEGGDGEWWTTKRREMRRRRGRKVSPSLVTTSIGVVRSPPTQRMRDADNYVEGGDGEWWTTKRREMRRRRGRKVSIRSLPEDAVSLFSLSAFALFA